MRRFGACLAAAALSVTAVTAMSTQEVQAQDKELTLCWAAWDPANALAQLGKDFTAETGIEMNYEFVPWTNFADRFINELNSGGKLCDLLIGDSQWIGGSATYGHYIKLNDFFEKEGISMDDFAPATVHAYSTWPKGTPNYWALPAMGDALGWVYRKDWFARPELREEFKAKYGHELEVPKNWNEVKNIGEFFQGREIDGKKVYGLGIYTERGSEGITMGVTAAMYSWGFQYENPDKPYDMPGYVNSAEAVEALEFYKSLYDCCTPPGHSDAYMVANLDAYKSGQVAMQMNWFAFFPGIAKDEDVGGDKSGFFVNPAQNIAASTLGRAGHFGGGLFRQEGHGAGVHQVVRQVRRAEEVVVPGRLLLPRGCAERPELPQHRALRRGLPEGHGRGEGLLAGADLRRAAAVHAEAVHDYVVADKGTAQEALDKLIEDWTEVFEDDGKL